MSAESAASIFRWRPSLSLVLSLMGGFVDTAGFLALQGLFTSHVTGNFVTLGAALVFGTSGTLTKLLALPTFCLVIFLVRLLSLALSLRQLPALRTIITIKVVLLTIGCILAIALGPFGDGDRGPALLTGLTLVSAMAIQNVVQRLHLGSAPPTTFMTGNATQLMIDLADLVRGEGGAAREQRIARLTRLSASIISFVTGCAAAALLFSRVGVSCFVVPPILGLCTLTFDLTQFDVTHADRQDS